MEKAIDLNTAAVKQLWEARAAALGKPPTYVEVNLGKFPPDYQFTLNWPLIQLQPAVTDPNLSGRWNEEKFYERIMGLFADRAAETLARIKRSDRAQAIRIEALLKRIEAEEPSSELLGLYATYMPILQSAKDAQAAAATVQSTVNADAERVLAEIGKRYVKVLHAGKAVLYDVINDEWTTYRDCADHFADKKVQVLNPDTGKYTTKNAFMAFKEWERAPRYNSVVFDPSKNGHDGDQFNLWQGFAIQPEAGDDDLLVWELLSRICDDNEAYFEYVQKWLAHMIQKPWERPGTALGMSGSQGLGKNAFVETFGMLLSTKQMIDLMTNQQTGMIGKVLSTGAFGYFTSYDEVFGAFNALAGNKILLFLDEATWGGGHTQKARLKTAITGQTVTINDKHMKHLVVPNYRRFIFASNEEFYYGADPTDRRLLPLEFKTENRPTEEWFSQFYDRRSKGKMLANLLHRLQAVDLTGWEPMRALRKLEIVTGAAIQSESAPDFQQWMDDIADTGTMLVPDNEVEEMRIIAVDRFVEEDQLRISYQKWTGSRDMKGWTRADFVAARDRIFGPRTQKRINGTKPYGRNVPAQAELRARLDAQYRWKRDRWGPLLDEGSRYASAMECIKALT
jgi:hypothetical protein